MTETLTGSDELEALRTRVSERTKGFLERGFWARVWERISGQRYRGLAVFEENQSDMLESIAYMASKVHAPPMADLGQQELKDK